MFRSEWEHRLVWDKGAKRQYECMCAGVLTNGTSQNIGYVTDQSTINQSLGMTVYQVVSSHYVQVLARRGIRYQKYPTCDLVYIYASKYTLTGCHYTCVRSLDEEHPRRVRTARRKWKIEIEKKQRKQRQQFCTSPMNTRCVNVFHR